MIRYDYYLAYDPNGPYVNMDRCTDGDWVRHSDVAALIAAAQAVLSAWKDMPLTDGDDAMCDATSRLRKAIAEAT